MKEQKVLSIIQDVEFFEEDFVEKTLGDLSLSKDWIIKQISTTAGIKDNLSVVIYTLLLEREVGE